MDRPRALRDFSLYHFEGCPACARVRRAAAELGIELELRDVRRHRRFRRQLFRATGRATVPVLRMGGASGHAIWLPESTEIIGYLKERFGPPR